jgi:hypothetical protein
MWHGEIWLSIPTLSAFWGRMWLCCSHVESSCRSLGLTQSQSLSGLMLSTVYDSSLICLHSEFQFDSELVKPAFLTSIFRIQILYGGEIFDSYIQLQWIALASLHFPSVQTFRSLWWQVTVDKHCLTNEYTLLLVCLFVCHDLRNNYWQAKL